MPKKPNQHIVFFILLGLAVGIFALIFYVLTPIGAVVSGSDTENSSQSERSDVACLQLKSDTECVANLEIADTNDERMKGLSNREFLADNGGMLFIFESTGEQCFWMKDTLIPLDMIWLNENKTVTKIEPNVQPSSYPDSFCSKEPNDLYVIELNSGKAGSFGIAVGQKLAF